MREGEKGGIIPWARAMNERKNTRKGEGRTADRGEENARGEGWKVRGGGDGDTGTAEQRKDGTKTQTQTLARMQRPTSWKT